MLEFMFHSVSCGAKPAAWIFAAVSTVVVVWCLVQQLRRYFA